MAQFFSAFQTGQIDAAKGKIFGVALIQIGPVAGHGLYADKTTLETCLSAAKRLGKCKVKLDHGNSAQDIIGSLSGYRIDGDTLRADLTLLKGSKHFDYVLNLCSELSKQIGMSLAFEPSTEKKDGKEFVRVVALHSVDLVDAPAATKALFDSTPTLTNTSSVVSVPTGHKPKSRTVSIVCPNCEKTTEFLSKLNDLHVGAANKLQSFVDAAETQQRDNISSQNTEAEFERRLEAQRLELEKEFDKKTSIAACRMLSATGIKLSKIPDADTCMASAGDILDKMNAIQDPTEQGLFYQANRDAVNAAFQKRSAKNIQLGNQR